MRRSRKILLTIMALFSLIVLFALTSCSSEETDNCECNGKFGNTRTGEIIHLQTDCEKTPPTEEWVFIECVDKPDY